MPDLGDKAPSFVVEWSQKIDSFLDSSHPGMLQIVAVSIGIILIFLVKGLSEYGSSVILTKIGNNIISRQQRRIGSHILKQSLAFFVAFPSSDLITRVSHAATAARSVMNLLMTRVQDVFTAIALMIAMFKLDWRLSCVALLILAPVSIALGSIIRRIRSISRSQYKGLAQVISGIQESIIGSKLIKSYNLESSMEGRFDDAIKGVEKVSNKMAVVSARTSPSMEFIGGVAVACIVFYGGYRNLVLGQSADSLIAFLTALLLAYEPVKRIAKMNVSLHSALIGVEMLYNILDSDYTIPDKPDAKPLSISRGEVSLKDVTFSYRPNQPVLRDVSLTCSGGHVTALVGPSGSGKSTILNLIERFYAVDSGRIEIDGQEISGLKTESLRANMSLVSQDTFLFSDTLRNNIRFARPDATDAEIEAAARAAFAHDFIMEQPQGYDTQVGENGGSLSGGQRQRISIARAFLKNAPILLLDEATSALDSESEKQIQLAFDTLMKGRTTIVIAHRFSTIRNARTIHVMQNGKVVASGSHQELISDEKSLYAHLYRLQYEESA
jgi:ATP-binding cassette subfamily B protein